MEHPILFNGPMVRAILAGTKTQTRRPIKPQPVLVPEESLFGRAPGSYWWPCNAAQTMLDVPNEVASAAFCASPMGGEGDMLWVRETFAVMNPKRTSDADLLHEVARPNGSNAHLFYRATAPYFEWDDEPESKWSPSIHMPRWASRLTLRVTDVRVQRLHDITEADAIAEGVIPAPFCKSGRAAGLERVEAFEDLWTSVYGTWNENPWVWAVSFERMEGAA